MHTCDQCRAAIHPNSVQSTVYDQRIYTLCAACHEQLANILKPAIRIHALSARE